MYLCHNCGNTFSEPETAYMSENLDGERGIWRYTIAQCPYCRSDDIEEEKDYGADEVHAG